MITAETTFHVPGYYDNAATTFMSENAKLSCEAYLDAGNPNTRYRYGRRAKTVIENARMQAAHLVGSAPEHIIFTSGGSEANNLAVRGIANHLKIIGKTKVLVSAVEHDSLYYAAHSLTREGFDVVDIPPDDGGVIRLSAVTPLLDDKTGLVCVMMVNNETGKINMTSAISNAAHNYGALFMTDVVQAISNFDINAEAAGFDFISWASHKIHGPKGAGALYARDIKLISPVIYGGESQEFGLRGGTQNVSAIAGFGAACQELRSSDVTAGALQSMCNKLTFIKELHERYPDFRYTASQDAGEELSSTSGRILNIILPGVDAESLILALGEKDICISAGSACHEDASRPSRVLTACGVSPDDARSAIRISFDGEETDDELVNLAKEIASTAAIIKSESEGFHGGVRD